MPSDTLPRCGWHPELHTYAQRSTNTMSAKVRKMRQENSEKGNKHANELITAEIPFYTTLFAIINFTHKSIK